jgi:hypothetical protein
VWDYFYKQNDPTLTVKVGFNVTRKLWDAKPGNLVFLFLWLCEQSTSGSIKSGGVAGRLSYLLCQGGLRLSVPAHIGGSRGCLHEASEEPRKVHEYRVELNHRETNSMLNHTNNGGAPGTQSSRGPGKNNSGAITPDVHEHGRKDEKRQILEIQNRKLWDQIKDTVDMDFIVSCTVAETVWPTSMDRSLRKVRCLFMSFTDVVYNPMPGSERRQDCGHRIRSRS